MARTYILQDTALSVSWAERVLEGTGLFLGTGVALERAGPLSIFLAFTIVGTIFDSGVHEDRLKLTSAD